MEAFYDRFQHFVRVTNPSTLIYSNENILEAKSIVQACDSNSSFCASPQQMEHYRRLVDVGIHPATGDVIPRLFRVSAIAPVNIPLVYLMLACPASNIPGTLFLHWFNQSYNTACNYANRSGSEQSFAQTMKAYVLAVSSACSFAYGLGRVVSSRYGVIVPCIATAAANCSNLGFTRAAEVTNGVSVWDKDHNVIGVSKVAGVQGVFQTAVTRCMLVPMACLLLPPAVMNGLKKLKFAPKSRSGLLLLELGLIYTSLQLALPAALAVFPQVATFDVKDLEVEFHNLVDKSGDHIKYVHANKGL